MILEEDHRFADVAFSAVSDDDETRMARMAIDSDPADGSVALMLVGVAALDVSHVGC